MAGFKLRLPHVGERWVDLDIGRSYWVPDGPAEQAKADAGQDHGLTTQRRVVVIEAVFPAQARVSIRSVHTGRVTEVALDRNFHSKDSRNLWDRVPTRGFMREIDFKELDR